MNATKTARQYILELVEWEESNGYVTTDLIAAWCNCQSCSIDDQGDVWIDGAGNGQWLSADSLNEFVAWHKSTI